MLTVTEEVFFSKVRQLDVHPSIVGGYDRVKGYTSHWKLRDGRLVGISYGGNHLCPSTYMVSA